MKNLIDIGKQIYDTSNPREFRRLIVFLLRAGWHTAELDDLMAFFSATPQRRAIIEACPIPLEQATRSFFYSGSTIVERVKLIKSHFSILESRLNETWFLKLGSCRPSVRYEIWRSEYDCKPWVAVLVFEDGQRKEGLLSIELNLGPEHLYQMMFWLAKDKEGIDSLWIGAMQGPNMHDAKEMVKKMTKRCFGYRTKNLILYMTQAVARALNIGRIYAVTNMGYYANNHMRTDRKLKTDFSVFWEEAGGHPTEDERFYGLPLVEPRKSIEEVKSQKRNLYRKRFAFLDSVDDEIAQRVGKILR